MVYVSCTAGSMENEVWLPCSWAWVPTESWDRLNCLLSDTKTKMSGFKESALLDIDGSYAGVVVRVSM